MFQLNLKILMNALAFVASSGLFGATAEARVEYFQAGRYDLVSGNPRFCYSFNGRQDATGVYAANEFYPTNLPVGRPQQGQNIGEICNYFNEKTVVQKDAVATVIVKRNRAVCPNKKADEYDQLFTLSIFPGGRVTLKMENAGYDVRNCEWQLRPRANP